MSKSLQKKLEEKSFDILWKLEDELEFESLKIPEVYYIGKTSSFEELGLGYEYKFDYDYVKKLKKASICQENKMIISATFDDEVLGEEMGHYLQFLHTDFEEKTPIGKFYFRAITEMVGFFSSRLISPKRKNEFKGQPDLFENKKEFKDYFKVIIKEHEKGRIELENLIYTQGYALGEKMYDYYISGVLPLKKVQEIFTDPLKKESDAVYLFHHLKEEVLI